MKDWTNNSKSVLIRNGASNQTDAERQKHDYYATEPKATEVLLENETFNPEIWEPACGEGYMSKVLESAGYKVYSSDLIYRGYGDPKPFDFLKDGPVEFNGDIITNPPYKYAKEFVERALNTVKTGNKVAMFLKLTFLESKTRKELFRKYPPKVVYVSSSRLQCAKNGDFVKYGKGVGTAVAYAWYVWEKGYQGPTQLKWIN